MNSLDDLTIPPDHVQRIHDALGDIDKTILMVENSGHVITRNAQRQQVFAAAHQFIQRVLQGNL